MIVIDKSPTERNNASAWCTQVRVYPSCVSSAPLYISLFISLSIYLFYLSLFRVLPSRSAFIPASLGGAGGSSLCVHPAYSVSNLVVFINGVLIINLLFDPRYV